MDKMNRRDALKLMGTVTGVGLFALGLHHDFSDEEKLALANEKALLDVLAAYIIAHKSDRTDDAGGRFPNMGEYYATKIAQTLNNASSKYAHERFAKRAPHQLSDSLTEVTTLFKDWQASIDAGDAGKLSAMIGNSLLEDEPSRAHMLLELCKIVPASVTEKLLTDPAKGARR